MEWIETLKDVNFWAVLAATVSTFVVGATWYSKAMFEKQWMKEEGLKRKDVDDQKQMMRAMAHTAVASFITASALAALLIATSTEGVVDSAIFGAVVGFSIVMTSMVTHHAFARKSMLLTQINGLHDIVKFAVMAGVLGWIGVM